MLRRNFLAMIGTAAALPNAGLNGALVSRLRKRLLILGGTNFAGRAIVTEALERGHEVTLFNRGITRPYLFPSVEKLHGTRSSQGGDLRSLGAARRWDAVVDVWPEDRGLVQKSAELLRDRTD